MRARLESLLVRYERARMQRKITHRSRKHLKTNHHLKRVKWVGLIREANAFTCHIIRLLYSGNLRSYTRTHVHTLARTHARTHGTARHGTARHGTARHAKAYLVIVLLQSDVSVTCAASTSSSVLLCDFSSKLIPTRDGNCTRMG